MASKMDASKSEEVRGGVRVVLVIVERADRMCCSIVSGVGYSMERSVGAGVPPAGVVEDIGSGEEEGVEG